MPRGTSLCTVLHKLKQKRCFLNKTNAPRQKDTVQRSLVQPPENYITDVNELLRKYHYLARFGCWYITIYLQYKPQLHNNFPSIVSVLPSGCCLFEVLNKLSWTFRHQFSRVFGNANLRYNNYYNNNLILYNHRVAQTIPFVC
jgi:hypothetical protein